MFHTAELVVRQLSTIVPRKIRVQMKGLFRIIDREDVRELDVVLIERMVTSRNLRALVGRKGCAVKNFLETRIAVLLIKD